MKTIHIARSLGLAALALVAAAPAMAQSPKLKANSASSYGIQISMPPAGKSSGKPSGGDSRSAAVSVFDQVPSVVRLSADKGVRLSRTKSSAASSQLSVSTGGRSTFVRVFAHSRGAEPMPMAFSITKKGDTDPCTGRAPVGTVKDLTAKTPGPQKFTHVYWKLRCRKGQGCHWIKVTCHHSPGVP